MARVAWLVIMRMPAYPWKLDKILEGKPTVGLLMDLCEENYCHLLRLAPDLRSLSGRYLSRGSDEVDLYMEVLEQTPYTTVIHLTYYFQHDDHWLADPDATLRIYHDSRQVEVLNLRQHVLPLGRECSVETLRQKWKLNLFLGKWLGYCVSQGHYFTPAGHLQPDQPLPFLELV